MHKCYLFGYILIEGWRIACWDVDVDLFKIEILFLIHFTETNRFI